MDCFGCKLANKEEAVHIVFEDDYISCILDHKPYNEGHVLILPKRHIQYFDEFDEHSAKSLMKASGMMSKAINKLFNPEGITVCQNGGAFDELTHFHMHMVPLYKGQNFAEFFTQYGDTDIEAENKLAETKRKLIDTIKGLD